MEVTVEAIKALREQSGAGVMDCKKALADAQGDMQKAVELLRIKGISIAANKASREAKEGIVDCYVHSGNRVGAIVEVNCETDFVARTQEFRDMVHDLAMQVAAMSPLYVDQESIPEGVDGSPQEISLLQQPYIKDPSKTVHDVINDVIGKVGENVQVRRFIRFALGE